MKSIPYLLFISLTFSTTLFSQTYYEDTYSNYEEAVPMDEGSFNSELDSPLSDDYYLSEELERQEEEPYESYPQDDWSLENEDLPVDEFDTDY
jgi:hypothetical protein